jgi:hypothetical protein
MPLEVLRGVVGAHAGQGDQGRDSYISDFRMSVLPWSGPFAGVGAAGADDRLGGFPCPTPLRLSLESRVKPWWMTQRDVLIDQLVV